MKFKWLSHCYVKKKIFRSSGEKWNAGGKIPTCVIVFLLFNFQIINHMLPRILLIKLLIRIDDNALIHQIFFSFHTDVQSILIITLWAVIMPDEDKEQN